ncbi:sel1 repeat family protein [Streptomyces anulatus]|uniref:sel1 repeat family protein n=1 Tax=Streptomyces anulatus TaxID=1892 RepID=UPI0032442E83
MDDELTVLTRTLMRGIDSFDPGVYELVVEALENTTNSFLLMRLNRLREVASGGDMSDGEERKRGLELLELLRETRRTSPHAYEELKAIADAFGQDERERAAPRLRPHAPVPPATVNRNGVSGGVFEGPMVQAGTLNGGVYTYYGQPQHTGLPPVTDWPLLNAADPITAGVRRTRQIGDESPLPRYVARDGDAVLEARVREAAASGGLVLVTGEPLAGKSRTAWSAMVTTLPGTTRVFAPSSGTDLRGLPALLRDRGREQCVLWLDELEGHLGERGLTPALLAELVQRRVPVIATMSDEAYEAHRFGGQARTRVLVGVEPLELSAGWTEAEMGRLEEADEDNRLGDAHLWCEGTRIAAHLAVAPELWDEWWRARRINAHPHGHLLVRVAMDLAMCGTDDTPIPATVLRELCTLYEEEAARAAGESFEDALTWAAGVRLGVTGMLVPGSEPDTWRAFSTLYREAVSRPEPRPAPLGLWIRALDAVGGNQRLQRFVVETAQEELSPTADGRPEVGLVLGRLYEAIGQGENAEGWFRHSADAGGVEAAGIVGQALADRGNAVEAIPYLERAAEAGAVDIGARLAAVLAGRAVFWLEKLAESGSPEADRYARRLREAIGPQTDTVKE